MNHQVLSALSKVDMFICQFDVPETDREDMPYQVVVVPPYVDDPGGVPLGSFKYQTQELGMSPFKINLSHSAF